MVSKKILYSLTIFFYGFSLYSMQLSKNIQHSESLNALLNEYIKQHIIKRSIKELETKSSRSDIMIEFDNRADLLQQIKASVQENNYFQILNSHGLSTNDLEKLYETDLEAIDLSIFENLKKANIKINIEQTPSQLCPMIQNTFDMLDCKNNIYKEIKNYPNIINQIAFYHKKDAMLLMEELSKHTSKPALIGLLSSYKNDLNNISNFCPSDFNLLKKIKNKVLGVCKRIMHPYSKTALSLESFGQSTLSSLESSEFEQSMAQESSEIDPLDSFKESANRVILQLEQLKNPSSQININNTKERIIHDIDNMVNIIIQIEKIANPLQSKRLLRLNTIKNKIKRLQSFEDIDNEGFIKEIKSAKNVTIQRIQRIEQNKTLEESGLQFAQEYQKIDIQDARVKRKNILDLLKNEDKQIKDKKTAIKLLRGNERKKEYFQYISLIEEHIKTLEQYLSFITLHETGLKKRTEEKIAQNKKSLEYLMNEILLPYVLLEKPLIIEIFEKINNAKDIESLAKAIEFCQNKKLLLTKLYTTTTKPEAIANQYLNNIKELKKIIFDSYFNSQKTQNVCISIPFFLEQLYTQQQFAKDDALMIVQLLKEHRQGIPKNFALVEAIVSMDQWTKEKNQACLMLLNKMCSFYPQLQSKEIEEKVNAIAQEYAEKQTAENIFNSIRALTFTAFSSMIAVPTTKKPEIPTAKKLEITEKPIVTVESTSKPVSLQYPATQPRVLEKPVDLPEVSTPKTMSESIELSGLPTKSADERSQSKNSLEQSSNEQPKEISLEQIKNEIDNLASSKRSYADILKDAKTIDDQNLNKTDLAYDLMQAKFNLEEFITNVINKRHSQNLKDTDILSDPRIEFLFNNEKRFTSDERHTDFQKAVNHLKKLEKKDIYDSLMHHMKSQEIQFSEEEVPSFVSPEYLHKTIQQNFSEEDSDPDIRKMRTNLTDELQRIETEINKLKASPISLKKEESKIVSNIELKTKQSVAPRYLDTIRTIFNNIWKWLTYVP